MRIAAQKVTKDDKGVRSYELLPLHKCTEEDWEQFYSPEKATEQYLNNIELDTQ